ncbi:hypothetical protein HAX54_039038, partial [Datura stramonium]|nr:hypothetical protein [Datura stramonium]
MAWGITRLLARSLVGVARHCHTGTLPGTPRAHSFLHDTMPIVEISCRGTLQ